MFAIFNLGTAELLVILAIGLLLFGNRLPGLARSLGQCLMELKEETSKLTDEVRSPGK